MTLFYQKRAEVSVAMLWLHMQAVWFSASADLAIDATRDFWDIGAYK